MRHYDPLTVNELGHSAARALLRYPAVTLPPTEALGNGIYAIYYGGTFPAYTGLGATPIYVGKSHNLQERLGEHARSIDQAYNLSLDDFDCRWLELAPIWLTLTEDILIGQYRPIWNAIRGFGNHHQGTTRRAQRRSQWDTLHPGRPWADSYQQLDGGADGVLEAIRRHREGGTHG